MHGPHDEGLLPEGLRLPPGSQLQSQARTGHEWEEGTEATHDTPRPRHETKQGSGLESVDQVHTSQRRLATHPFRTQLDQAVLAQQGGGGCAPGVVLVHHIICSAATVRVVFASDQGNRVPWARSQRGGGGGGEKTKQSKVVVTGGWVQATWAHPPCHFACFCTPCVSAALRVCCCCAAVLLCCCALSVCLLHCVCAVLLCVSNARDYTKGAHLVLGTACAAPWRCPPGRGGR